MNKEYDPAVKQLCSAILLNTVRDWKMIVSEEQKFIFSCVVRKPNDNYFSGENYISIKKFLTSNYGESICDAAGINAEKMVENLELYRLRALSNERKRVMQR